MSHPRRPEPTLPSHRSIRGAALAAVLLLGGCGMVGGQGPEFASAAGPQPDPMAVQAAGQPAIPAGLLQIVPRSKPRLRSEARVQVAAATPAELHALPEGFIWPVQGQVLQGFGTRTDGGRSDGLDIQAAEGTPVRAAQAGTVSYAGNAIPGYGNMLLLTHPGGFVTVYAHNDRLLVSAGETVYRGQLIATVGRSGGLEVAELHFQLRAGERPLDPVRHLERGETVLASAMLDPMPRAAAE